MTKQYGTVKRHQVKAGITLFKVHAYTEDDSRAGVRRTVGPVERLYVLGRPKPVDVGTSERPLFIYKIPLLNMGRQWNDQKREFEDKYLADYGFCGDLGIRPSGWRQGLYRTKCFTSYARALSYRKLLLALPITDVEIDVHMSMKDMNSALDEMVDDHQAYDSQYFAGEEEEQ